MSGTNSTEQNFLPCVVEICHLLDDLEIAISEKNYDNALDLVYSRFDLLENHGFTIVFPEN